MNQKNDFVYNNGNYAKYTSKNPLKRKMLENLNKRIITQLVQIVSEDTGNIPEILDAGCGEGFITSRIAESIPNAKVTGLEYTQEAIDIARNQFPDVTFCQGDVMNLNYEDASMDVVVCTEVLEHLTNPQKALSELYRVAKNYVLITVPNEPWFCMGNLIALKNVTRLGNPIDHINHWTFKKFHEFIFSIVKRDKCSFLKSFPWTICIIKK